MRENGRMHLAFVCRQRGACISIHVYMNFSYLARDFQMIRSTIPLAIHAMLAENIHRESTAVAPPLLRSQLLWSFSSQILQHTIGEG